MADELQYNSILQAVMDGRDLTESQSHFVFGQIMDGACTPAQIAAMLAALATKGETVDEIVGAAMAMREHSVKIDAAEMDVLDTCGTGGTGRSTINVSTAVAFVAAAAGAKVAKHGNRTYSRASGSADVLAALGVNIEATPEIVSRCLREVGCCFCFAVKLHPAMKHAGPVRRELGVRTIFNLLGPLTNPAGARRQLMGLYDGELTELIAKVLGRLGATRAMVVHADDGLDEISTTSATRISSLAGDRVTTSQITPEEFGLLRAKLDDLKVASAAESAKRIRKVLAGVAGPDRDIIILNAAAALTVAGRSDNMHAGLKLAADAIDSHAGEKVLQKLIEVSNS